MIRSKSCFKCNTVQPLSEFQNLSSMEDVHVIKFKSCNKKDVNENRLKNIDYYREYDRERAKNYVRQQAAYEISKAWREADTRRIVCHSAVARAVKSGDLVRQPCVRCQNEKSLAHHEDYDKPLEVFWLCQPCHKQRHKEILKETL